MSGVELLEVAARDHPDTARILVTAYSDLDAAISAINRGRVSRYVRKPWTPEDLGTVISEALELREMRARVHALEARLRETERVYAAGVVAASIAHDLRNPLTVVRAALELMRRGLPADAAPSSPVDPRPRPDPARLLASLGRAENAVSRMTDIVAGLSTSQRRTTATRTDDLADVVRLSISCMQGALRRRGGLDVDLEDVPAVEGSPTAMSQVVMNLLVNAFEALPPGGQGSDSVVVRLRSDGQAAVLEVRDTGSGIPREVVERVFDPFFTTKEDGGTGLGLAISKRIVDEVGGSIQVWSELGTGTQFTVRLPFAPAH
jgi:signal transduction histidine kinase